MTGIGENYAQALYDLAKEENAAQIILQELKLLNDAFSGSPDFVRLLAAPNLAKDQRAAVIDDSFRAKVHPYVLNFLKLLTDKGHIRAFPDCVKAYRQKFNADNGIVSVQAVAAAELTTEQQEKLRSKLEEVTGKRIDLSCRVDASCIGGLRLDYDGKRVDGTVKSRLDTLRSQLNSTAL